jgi:hypothetical protein
MKRRPPLSFTLSVRGKEVACPHCTVATKLSILMDRDTLAPVALCMRCFHLWPIHTKRGT